MNEVSFLGRILIIAGVILVLVGIVFVFGNKIPWIGKLPGDIYIQKKNLTLYFPITTSILISVVLSLILMLWSKR
ncbi:MAG: DUF2905 domain-containing protein [Candidatus Omnitrophica bacterium]|nr:DUF2905 domain-containing protein [Candidatus Omnitrophota bacterium]